MALMMMTAVGPKLPLQRNKSRISRVMVPISLKATLSRTTERANACNVWEGQSLTFLHQRGLRHSPWSTFAVGPGLEASISDPSKNDIRLDNVKIVIESRDNDKITVPKSFLLQMLGRDRVTKFLIQEIVGITIGDYVKKACYMLMCYILHQYGIFLIAEIENLKVKSQFKTIQTAEELEAAFTPGSEFGFNAVILPLTQEKEAVSEFASTRAAINTLRWFIWSYLPQYKAPPMSCMASAAVGSDGIAPFLVVVIAPQAFANLSSSLNFFSSCNKSQNPSPHASHYRYMNQSTVSHVVYLQSRLVFDDLPQQCADECVACSGRVDLFDGVGLDAAMEILDPRKPAKSA
ncbi:Bacterial trigger factor protein (TF) [Musa troglodytarum]|uniref:Bacterial trigger factor protein (TF) n=1 Tax=Musa troglodytarum TaxID=320322 RepID=A0A9E7JDW3_9LILI|nr:Bacterial trigger factor protein (TF) [Musa troglodytarum]URD84784.1 Bacterial trigger factor protein (TF) [Musa troglodytarum]